jgi:hypothetical protein
MPLEVREVNPKMPSLIESKYPKNERELLSPFWRQKVSAMELSDCGFRTGTILRAVYDVQRIEEQLLTIRSSRMRTCQTVSGGPANKTELESALNALRPRVAGPRGIAKRR